LTTGRFCEKTDWKAAGHAVCFNTKEEEPAMYEIVKIAVEVAFVAIVAYAIYSAVKKKKK
jgi:uncharacterized metal-binding protein